MTIKEIMDIALDDGCIMVEIYDIESGHIIEDLWYNIRDEYEDYEVCSWNLTDNGVCFNIEL